MVKNSSQNGSAHVVVVIILVVVLIGALGFIFWQNFLKSPVGEWSRVEGTQNTEKQPPSENRASYVLNIPELNLKLDVDSKLKGLAYQYNRPANAVTFNSDEMSKYCSLEVDDAPLGAVFKVDGQYPGEPSVENTPGVLMKQYSDFYLAYRSPQQSCSQQKNDEVVTEIMSRQIPLLKQSLQTSMLLED
jgi:hypothetical protein